MLPADYGDALHISYGCGAERHHLWIDGGLVKSYRQNWRPRVRQLAAEGARIDLLVVSHIDEDHINGVRAFVEENQRQAKDKDFLPIDNVWFNQYRHIRPYASGEEPVDSALRASVQWPSTEDFVEYVSGRATRYAPLVSRLARTSREEMVPKGVSEGRTLARLLDGNYPSNEGFAEGAVVREDEPPVVDLPGGAKAWVLSPTKTALGRLFDVWQAYLKERSLEEVLAVRGTGPMTAGEALVPGFVQNLMLWDPEPFEAPLRGREEDLALPIEDLAQRDFEEDDSEANHSSIALLFEYADRRLLLTGDAYPSELVEGLKAMGYSPDCPLPLDAFKLAHHGSRANTSGELLDLVDCNRYLISTSGARFDHPDKECLARVIWANRCKPDTALYFNYQGTDAEEALDVQADRCRYGYRIEHLRQGQPLRL
jgi:hypothetical protein